ncbi:P-loop NTPase family protein [Fusibacter tunisiensis]|uniref:MinD-like ATPase involved in chromosome partitioning or flagellar assembly n=1 Tax=Fusibacter tunisiensis TaxID=1008308 RepID=A0ABS2MNK6_9FIRM|nr:hypothetical protein [Fusibacter tunisiensis]MBM7560982.1 MinD-like ATPase involved in chromosome partitioning or flagellar assembly [Fusibacter tunisiensis]
MSTFLYFKDPQNEAAKELISKKPNLKRIEHNLKHPDLKSDQVLVVLSQPSELFIQRVQEIGFSRILTLKGVGIVGKNVQVCDSMIHICKSLEELDLIKEAREKRQYAQNLEQTLHLTDTDKTFLKVLGGQVHKKGSKTRVKMRQRKNYQFPHGVITVIGESKVCSELAKSLARDKNGRILLIDGNLLKPSMDVHFNIKNIQTPIKSHLVGIDNSGLNIALDAIGKGISFVEMLPLITKKVTPHLELLLGNYNFYNYEHYQIDRFKDLMEVLKTRYTIILIYVAATPYDELALASLHLSHVNLWICKDEQEDLRYAHSVMEVLKNKQQIPSDKFKMVLCQDQKRNPLIGPDLMNRIFKNQYLGNIGGHKWSRKRKLKRLGSVLVERGLQWE